MQKLGLAVFFFFVFLGLSGCDWSESQKQAVQTVPEVTATLPAAGTGPTTKPDVYKVDVRECKTIANVSSVLIGVSFEANRLVPEDTQRTLAKSRQLTPTAVEIVVEVTKYVFEQGWGRDLDDFERAEKIADACNEAGGVWKNVKQQGT